MPRCKLQGVYFSTIEGLERASGASRGILGEIGGGGRRTSARGTSSFGGSENFDGPGVASREAT